MQWWPTTFILPRDMHEATAMLLRRDRAGRPAHTFIFKPDSAFGGNGVYLAQSADALHAQAQRRHSQAVLQEYVARPLLLDGLKCALGRGGGGGGGGGGASFSSAPAHHTSKLTDDHRS
jgi:hypothetical protein